MRKLIGLLLLFFITFPAFAQIGPSVMLGGARYLPPAYFSATGGTMTTSGNYQIHTFSSNGTFEITSGTCTGDYLIVAGGGGGGGGGNTGFGSGGGGAGGVLSGSLSSLAAGSYSVTVGAGGAGGIGNNSATTDGTDGGNSVFNGITATGGGGGARGWGGDNGHAGGSGGGASKNGTAGAGTAGQGRNGGIGSASAGAYGGGGGGGAGALGGAGTNLIGGSGGYGIVSSITGSSVYYGGGGGGGRYNTGTAASGGLGGGGDGNATNTAGGSPGTDGLGGGGGGGGTAANTNGGDGGDGTVIIRCETTPQSFSPNNYASLVLWLDASDASTITESGGAVSQWSDKSGAGNHMTQGTGANQPATGADTINGLNVIKFDGTSDVVYGTAPVDPASNNLTIFAVTKGAPTTNYDDVWAFGSGLLRQEESTTFRVYGTNVVAIDGVALGVSSTANIVSFRANGLSDFSAWYNGANEKTGTSTGLSTSSNFYVGARTESANQWEGDIAEIIIYNRALTDSEMNQVGQYLSAKWGMTWTDL